jgi:hypothetical protein
MKKKMYNQPSVETSKLCGGYMMQGLVISEGSGQPDPHMPRRRSNPIPD